MDLFEHSKKKEKPSLKERFEKFDEEHPDVWEAFIKIAFDLMSRGRKFYSADAILHVIRFNYHTSSQGQAPKISNDFTACYARKWAAIHPEYKSFFRYKKSQVDAEVV